MIKFATVTGSCCNVDSQNTQKVEYATDCAFAGSLMKTSPMLQVSSVLEMFVFIANLTL